MTCSKVQRTLMGYFDIRWTLNGLTWLQVPKVVIYKLTCSNHSVIWQIESERSNWVWFTTVFSQLQLFLHNICRWNNTNRYLSFSIFGNISCFFRSASEEKQINFDLNLLENSRMRGRFTIPFSSNALNLLLKYTTYTQFRRRLISVSIWYFSTLHWSC